MGRTRSPGRESKSCKDVEGRFPQDRLVPVCVDSLSAVPGSFPMPTRLAVAVVGWFPCPVWSGGFPVRSRSGSRVTAALCEVQTRSRVMLQLGFVQTVTKG